ncbi:Ig-like domain-containing protein [Microbacterium album]|nr:Ig-like domain-containing protein [Microbacterium album]
MSWLSGRPRTLAGAAIVTAAAIGVTTMAVAYEGNPTTEVDLHDGSVWITKADQQFVGHFNSRSQLLDGRLIVSSMDYDVLQDGDRVLVQDRGDNSLALIDPAAVTLGNRTELPPGAVVDYARETVAVLDPREGALYVVPLAGITAFSPAEAEPVLELGEGAAVTVGRDGTVHAVSVRDAMVYTVPVTREGEPEDPRERAVEGIGETSDVTITSVGSVPVVLDAQTGTLVVAGGPTIELPDAEDARLALDAAESDSVIVATRGELLRVPLDGSAIDVTPTDGPEGLPTEPVWLDGCAYGAWMHAGWFVRDCIGEQHDLAMPIADYDVEGELRFRVNRDVVMLNNVLSGAAWLASDLLQKVDNWDDLTPPEGDGVENPDPTTVQVPDPSPPDRGEENTPPIANADRFGVRAGQTTVLPVLDNDSDPDGDVLTVTLPDGSPSLGDVQLIHNGTALQIVVPSGASGSDSFVYQVDDGRGGTDRATVTLDVHPDSRNAGPRQNRQLTIPVETGGTVTYNVLPDWIDPDGDNIYLEAVYPPEGDEADFTADGRITYRAISGSQGPLDVPIAVSDGRTSTAGVLKLDVRPPGTTPPITTADHVVTRVGEQVTVSPLANDISASAEPLRLTRVDEVQGATIVADFAAKTFTFESGTEGTYYVQYLASTGPNAVPGLVRVDVVKPTSSDLPPVAVRDVALLPAGGEVLVNVLNNDSDPGGGVLVVQSVTADPSSGLSVSVLGHETLRISDRAVLSEQTTITYRISNGVQGAEGEVIVIPVPAAETLRPPVANDDTAVVRVGDVVTIPVLDNDYHPNDDEIHVAPELVETPDPSAGQIFVSQNTVRFRADSEPGTHYATYEVVDSTGQRDAGFITIDVLPIEEGNNAAPRPRDLTARALASSTTTILVPLDGIDADGDSVELVGLASAPGKGKIVETGADRFVYEAFADAKGVDTFVYRVRDRLGAEGTATVRIGIAPATTRNQAPYAVRDNVAMRPGRVVAVPVLNNDSDPDGDRIGLVPDGLILPDVDGLEAEVLGNRVVITSPDRPMETSLQYTIEDSRGAQAQGVVQISVDEDVPLQAPIARDDRVLVESIQDDLTAEVELLANDEDPDGTVEALTIELEPDDSAQLLADGVVRVGIEERRRLIAYTITDEDDQSATAFIHVPGTEDLRPTLISTEPVVVDSGETRELPLDEYVRVASGKQVRITEEAKVVAAHGNGDSLVVDAHTLVYTSADRYFGSDAITFEVTDGTGPDDPDGRTATLSLPITVRPPANEPPVFVDAELTVGAGDEEPATVDLAALATDIDDDPLQFEIAGGVPSGMQAQIVNDSTLSVTADPDQRGATAALQIRVSDGETDPVTGAVHVTVTSSTRQLPVATDDRVDEWNQGETLSLAVLENDVNPFPGQPLEVVSATAETGDADVRVAGDRVEITPASTFHGRVVARYRIADATGDEDRMVEGRIFVTVQGVPDRPGRPVVTSVQDRRVTMSWTPPADNGARITEYAVRSTNGDYETTCPATTCTLTGLTNNVEYNFVVVAINRVGESQGSLPSETARPDVRPDTPVPPRSPDFGDGRLQVTWVEPNTAGSPVSSYTVEISPAPPNGIATKTEVTGTSLWWDGLRNGESYQFRVRAHNAAPDPSSWSGWSVANVPAAPPDAPAQPTTERLEPVGTEAQLRVSWNAPAANGDPINLYELDVLSGGSVKQTLEVQPGTRTQTVAVPADSSDYTFRVRAHNKAGWGAHSAPSAPRQAFGVPGAPTRVSASTPQADSRIHVTWTPGSLNGARADQVRYEYSVNGGDWSGNWASGGNGSGQINGNNGTASTVRIRAVTTADGATYRSDASAPSNSATSYGPMRAPEVRASRVGDGTQIEFRWDARNSGNGREIRSVEVRFSGGGGWQGVSANGSTTRGYGHDTEGRIEVRVTDTAGQTVTASASQRTVPPPAPAATVSNSGDRTGRVSGCSTGNCYYMQLNYQHFPTGNYRVTCFDQDSDANGFSAWNGRLSGQGSQRMNCFYGYGGNRVRLHIAGPNGIDFWTPWWEWRQ